MATLILLCSITSAWAWPMDSQWFPLTQGYAPIHDPLGDAGGERNVVPEDGSLAAAYVYNDGVNAFYRIRLDDSAEGSGGQGYLRPFSWGFEIDTDQNADDYEWLIIINGLVSNEVIELRQNTVRSQLGDPSDKAEYLAAWYPVAGNHRIVPAGSCYNGPNPDGSCNVDNDDLDYFLDWKLPTAVLKAATGITDDNLIRYFVGSTSADNNLTESGADLVGGSDLYTGLSDFITLSGALPQSLTFYNGKVRLVDDLNGAFDMNLATPGDTLYIRVDDLDLNIDTLPIGEIVVTVTSPTGDTERVTLYSTGIQGKYTGSLSTNTTDSDGTLHILDGQTATVVYEEAIDANLNQNVTGGDNTATILFASNGTDLEVLKTVDNEAPIENEIITFTISVTNNGPSNATSLTISDVLPTGLTYSSHTPSLESYDDTTGVWAISSSLADGATATLSLSATVDPGTNGKTLTNNATLTASTPNDGFAENNTDSASVRVGGTDLRITKSVDDPLPLEGDTIVYTVRVLNLGPANTTGVQVTDQLPPGVSYVSYTANQGTYVSGTGLWDVGSLNSGAGALLRITATVDLGTVGQVITNTANLTVTDQPDTNSANDSDSASIKVEYLDLTLEKEVRRYSPTTSSFGDSVAADVNNTVEFLITVNNNGPHDATGIEVTDTIPVGLTYVATSASVSTGIYNSATGLWTLGNLNDKDDATLVFQATVDTGTEGQTLVNEAEITDVDQPDSTPGDEYDTASVTVDGTDLKISKSVSDQTPNVGDTITWTITIQNNGPNQATSVVVTDLLPDGVTYVTSKGKVVHTVTQGTFNDSAGTWDVGTLETPPTTPYSATLTFDTTVDTGTTGETIVNNAFITGADQADPEDSNNVASEYIAVGGTDLGITKTVNDITPNVGQDIVYTLTVTNNGPSDASNVIVNDLLPPELDYVSHTPTATNYNSATGVWDIGSLNNGSSTTLDITATVLNEDDNLEITNTAEVSATEADQDTSNNIAAIDITVNATDLSITKTVDNNVPNEGTLITYTLTTTNNSTNDASNVEVDDILPAGLTLVTSAPSQGAYSAGLWLIGDIAGNSSATLTITAVVNPGTASTTITNTAEITALDQIDTDSTNDISSVDITPVLAPIINLRKTVQTTYDPVNGSLNPYAIPGALVEYTITATNTGSAGTASNSVTLSDPVPANTAIYVGPAGGTTSPVTFSDGNSLTPALADSGLAYNFIDLESLSDDLEFYNGTTWNYVPSPDTDGYDNNIQSFRINFGNAINGASGGNTPTFEVKFSVRVQ
ncbi:DUF11 domain-containing protein [Deltaproteobacteria bacterium IMCC39524]|nr:DUF11 domain-containing protein [Deltaproteobacteria bacterium IMCC39524]